MFIYEVVRKLDTVFGTASIFISCRTSSEIWNKGHWMLVPCKEKKMDENWTQYLGQPVSPFLAVLPAVEDGLRLLDLNLNAFQGKWFLYRKTFSRGNISYTIIS